MSRSATGFRGKRSRKLARAIKRKRYVESFLRRYGMTRSEWREFKATHTPQEVMAIRKQARR